MVVKGKNPSKENLKNKRTLKKIPEKMEESERCNEKNCISTTDYQLCIQEERTSPQWNFRSE